MLDVLVTNTEEGIFVAVCMASVIGAEFSYISK